MELSDQPIAEGAVNPVGDDAAPHPSAPAATESATSTGRSKRAVRVVNYDERLMFEEVDTVLRNNGVEKSDDEDEEEEEDVASVTSSDYDSDLDDDHDHDHDHDDDDGKPRRMTRKKSPQEIEAERYTAQQLGVEYPAQFYEVRKNVEYAYSALGPSVFYPLHVVYGRLFPNQPLPEAQRDRLIEWIGTIQDEVRVPEQELHDIFHKLREVSGGYLVKTSLHFGSLVGMWLLGHMVPMLKEQIDRGASVQSFAFADLLQRAGLSDPNTLGALTAQYTTDTPLDSIKAEAKLAIADLNDIDGTVRVQAVYNGLVGFKATARAHQPDGYRFAERKNDISKFDHVRSKGERRRAKYCDQAVVSVTLLHRFDGEMPVANGRAQYPSDAANDVLASVYGGAQHLPMAVNYRRCYGFREPERWEDAHSTLRILKDKGSHARSVVQSTEEEEEKNEITRKAIEDATRAYYAAKAKDAPLVMTHRARTVVQEPTPISVIEEGLQPLLWDEALAPKLVHYLKATPHHVLQDKEAAGKVLDWPLTTDVYVGVKYDGVPLRLGQYVKGGSTLAEPDMRGPYNDVGLAHWMVLRNGVSLAEAADVLCPPWKLNAGSIEFFVLLTSNAPHRVLDHDMARNIRFQRKMNIELAKVKRDVETEYRRSFYPKSNTKMKRKLSEAERNEMGDEVEKAFADERPRVRARIKHDVFGADVLLRYPPFKTPKRQQDRARKAQGAMVRKAKRKAKTIDAAMPGGADVRDTTGMFGA